MKKLLIAAAVASLSLTTLVGANNAFAQNGTSTATKKKAKAPAPKHRLIKRKATKSVAANTDPVPDGSVLWSCEDGLSFDLKGDMKRDQIVTVHWAKKNYDLPREATTTGADRFHDAATGLDLVVIPTKAMLFSDHDGARLADECKTAAMTQGAPAPTQSNALKSGS